MRRFPLELGGKSPQVVFADADLEAALPVIVNAVVQNAGQICSAGRLPFGGVKKSGYGRDQGFEALYGFTVLKTVAIK